MAQVYGGDEIGAIVLDSGAAWTRVGWAGDDSPFVTMSTNYSVQAESRERRFDEEQLALVRPGWGVANPFEDSIVADWDAAEALWTRALQSCSDRLSESPLLITEHLWNTADNRSRTLELALEKFDCPATYIAKTAVCSLFAAGRGSGVVVDMGAQTTAITPVIDGLALYKPSRRSRRAGDYLDRCCQDLLGGADSIIPRYRVKSRTPVGPGEAAQFELRSDLGTLAESFEEYHRQRVLEDFKLHMVQVWDVAPKTPEARTGTERTYEFPDGHSISLSGERYELGEKLFTEGPADSALSPDNSEMDVDKPQIDNESVSEADAENTDADTGAAAKADSKPASSAETLKMPKVPEFSDKGLSALLAEAINACDVDARPNLLSNIVVVGGTSLVQGFNDRVQQDLLKEFPASKIRIFSPGNVVERCASAWLGGSILASLGTFHQMWVSKQEYSEVGAEQLVQRRFK